MRALPLLLLIVGCQSAATYEHQDLTERAQQYAVEYGPRVEEILGTKSAHESIRVRVADLEPGVVGLVNDERDSIFLSPLLETAEPVLLWAVVHELAHVHMTGVWDTLPLVIEEGMAESVAAILLPDFAPTALRQHSEDFKTGYEIVQRLGFENLRALAARAQTQGLSEIPRAWYLPPP